MLEDIIGCIRNYHNIQETEISEDSKLIYDLGITSYGLIELCCELEDTLGIQIQQDDIGNVETVGDILKCIENRKAG